jgi:glutathione S-transferase
VQKDVQRVNAYRNELIHGGGEVRVPCLRIEGRKGKAARWLYDGRSILEYIERRFSD